MNRYTRSKKIHKQSFGHPWPSADPVTPACLIQSGRPSCRKKVPLCRKARRRARFSFKQGQKISEWTKTENCTNFPGKSNPPESPEPVPSNMAVLERVHYLGTGSTPFIASSQLIKTYRNPNYIQL